jgi:heme-degrading monooxygenase HmoA
MIILTLTTTKPANTVWFPNFSDENKQAVTTINEWTKSQPGFIRQTTSDTDENTRVMTFEWDSVENYANWFASRNRLPEQIARVAYNRANGIISTSNETLS